MKFLHILYIFRYNTNLDEARQTEIKRGLMSGIGGGVMWFITYASYSLAFWYGVTLILDERDKPNPEYTPAILAVVRMLLLVRRNITCIPVIFDTW